MNRDVRAWAGPAAAGALLLALLAAGYLLLLRPAVTQYQRLTEGIRAQQRLLQEYEAEIRARPALLRQLETLRALERERGYHIAEESHNLAAVALRTLVDRSASATGNSCSIQSQQERPGAGEQATRIRVRARLRCSVEGLRRLLHDLEGGRPLVLVESLQVRPRPGRGAGNRDLTSLDTTLELSARYAGTVQ